MSRKTFVTPIALTAMEGDAAVGRHVAIGGNAAVRGSVTIDHDVTIKGRLDVREMNTAGKGLFASVEHLQQAYPNPEEGMWAYVGTQFPAAVFVVHDGVWTDSGTTDSPTIDLWPYTERLDALEEALSRTMPMQVVESIAAYDALPVKDPGTLYLILGDED